MNSKDKDNTKNHEDLRPYRTFGVPLIILMILLAAIGVIVTVVLKYFF